MAKISRKQIMIGAAVVVAAGAGAYVWHARSKKKKIKKLTGTVQEAIIGIPSSIDCDVSQWTEEDRAIVAQDITKAVTAAPAWNTLAEAREVAFTIVRNLFRRYCPGEPTPTKRYQVDQFLESQDEQWVSLWTTLNNRVWFSLIGSSEANN